MALIIFPPMFCTIPVSPMIWRFPTPCAADFAWRWMAGHYFDGSVQERHNFSVLGMELHLSCINPSIYAMTCYTLLDFIDENPPVDLFLKRSIMQSFDDFFYVRTSWWTNSWFTSDLGFHEAYLTSLYYLPLICTIEVRTMIATPLWPLLLTWFNFNPSMDK